VAVCKGSSFKRRDTGGVRNGYAMLRKSLRW